MCRVCPPPPAAKRRPGGNGTVLAGTATGTGRRQERDGLLGWRDGRALAGTAVAERR
ncbi:hypothetical protein GCM10009759_56010 [Kitasatospora saccharophila]|uniref:Uncharacterized protein n=1 Tax=Kitasatospora saccharophila TaxID=407973 RepID=A0ABN2XKT8_9ACTN